MSEYVPRLPLRPHQLEALRRAAARPSHPSDEDVFAYLLDMGLGKSSITLAEFGQREATGDLHDLLIVAPAGSYLNWCQDKSAEQQSEFNKHLSEDLSKRLVYAAWISGKKVSIKKSLDALLKVNDRPRALAVNIEALSSVPAARDLCAKFLSMPARRAMIVVDESTGIKGASIRADEVQKLGQMADCRRILTGLIAPKSPLDIYRQFAFLDWRILGHRSWFSFRARYATMRKMSAGGRTFQVVTGYKNVDELQAKIAPYSYRVLKDDALDLPPKVYQIKEVELTSEQQRIYREIKEFATSKIEAEHYVTATSVITQIIRLHQLVCGFATDDGGGGIRDVTSNRLDVLMNILSKHIGKVIIWAPYRYSIDQIVDRIGDAFGPGAVAAFHGGNRTTRSDDERRFLSDPKCRFMVSTPAAGGKGNTWVVANLVIYFGNNYDLELRAQSEDRCHRDGLKHQVTYIDLLARGTVDEKIIAALRKKIDMSTAITGETYREWLI